MTLRLENRWVWDSWYVWDNDVCHAFYLSADRSLSDPELRHRNPIVGHAISKDLTNWQILPDAIAPSTTAAFDSWSTWTGSTVKGDDGRWWMYYTGSSREDGGLVQSVGVAHSEDLVTWTKHSTKPIVETDGEFYELLGTAQWHDQAWRDPWVFKLDGEPSRWHMLITARANHGDDKSRGVVGHAVSEDMLNWKVMPPLSQPGSGFGQLEVFQLEIVNDVPVLLFCCGWRELDDDRLAIQGQTDGVYSTTCNDDLSGIDISKSIQFPDTTLYAARLVKNQKDEWFLLGFTNLVDGEFVGEICDPIPVKAVAGMGIVPR